MLAHVLAAALAVSAEADPVVDEPLSARDLIEAPVVGGGYAAKPLSVSPDGSRIAFQVATANVAQNDYQLDWYVLDLAPGSTPRRVADGGDLMLNIRQRHIVNGTRIDGVAKWSPDGQWIAFARQAGDEIQIWRAHAEGGRVEPLTDNAANVFGSTAHDPLFEWSRDGARIFYEVARPRAAMQRAMADEGARGFLFDDRFQPGAQLTPTWSRCGASRQAQAPLAGQACEPTLWTHEIDRAVDRPASETERAEYEALQFLANQWIYDETVTIKQIDEDARGRAAALENVDPQTYGGFLPPVQVVFTGADGARVRCGHAACVGARLQNIWLIGDEVVFLRRESRSGIEHIGFLAFYAWNPATNDLRRIKKTSDSYEGCAAAIRSLVCQHETATTPRRLVDLDLQTGTHRVLFDPAADLAGRLSARVEHLELEDEGRFAYAKLVYPAGYVAGRRYPLIIVQGHHRGFLEGGSGDEYPVHLFAQAGFFVLNASPFEDVSALETLSGEAAAEHAFRTFRVRRNALDAYRRYVDELDARGLIDPARVGVTGLSSGSVNARYALIHGDLFAVAALSTGYSGPQQYWHAPSEARARVRQVYYGGALPFEEPAEAFLAHEQLGWHAREIEFPPVLWQVSDSELSHAVFDHALLRDEGQPVEMYVFPDAYHIKHQPAHRYHVYRRNVQWMMFWLQGETVADPVDPGQYERWRALCAAHAARNPAEENDAAPPRCLRAVGE